MGQVNFGFGEGAKIFSELCLVGVQIMFKSSLRFEHSSMSWVYVCNTGFVFSLVIGIQVQQGTETQVFANQV